MNRLETANLRTVCFPPGRPDSSGISLIATGARGARCASTTPLQPVPADDRNSALLGDGPVGRNIVAGSDDSGTRQPNGNETVRSPTDGREEPPSSANRVLAELGNGAGPATASLGRRTVSLPPLAWVWPPTCCLPRPSVCAEAFGRIGSGRSCLASTTHGKPASRTELMFSRFPALPKIATVPPDSATHTSRWSPSGPTFISPSS